jgi:anti-sigma B factor antagonist
MSSTDPLLTIEVADEPDVCVIRVEGELDLPGMPDLESALANAELRQADRIVLDLDGLSFIDAGGLRMLVGAARRSANNGNRLTLTRGTGEVSRMFRLTMLDLTLPFTDPVEAQTSSVTPERVGS